MSQSTPNRRRGICHQFLNGSCRRGEQCKFLHERGGIPDSPPASPNPRRANGQRTQNRGDSSQPNQRRPRQGSNASLGSINSPPSTPRQATVSLNIRPSQPAFQRGNNGASAGPSTPQQGTPNARYHQQTPLRRHGEASSGPINSPPPAFRQGTAPPNNRPPQQRFQKGAGWNKFADWTDRITGLKQGVVQMRLFWEEALDIVEGSDPNLIQKVVEKLVDRDNVGRKLIDQVVNNDYTGPSGLDYLVTSVPFLLFLTYPEVINSLSIDRQVGTLYNYLYGTDGHMCVRFFGNIAAQLERENAPENRQSSVWKSTLLGGPAGYSKALASAVEGLRHTLRRNQNAGFNEAYKVVAESFCALAILIPQNDAFYTSIDGSLKEVIGIHRRANLIIVMPTPPPASEDSGTKAVLSSFPVDIDFPGYLANDGPRHDNDNISIREISLLPTLDEILCEKNDFLPYKDTSHPHFLSGVDRLLDTHFRLLRHDNIASLKDAVGMVFDLFKLPPRERTAAFKTATRKHIQGNFYDDVSVVKARFDKMKGLELVLRFQQPPPVINKTPKEQMKWWEYQKKRFDRGTLACLVTSNHNFRRATFLTIFRKEVDPARNDSLATGTYGHISVQIAESKRNEDIDFILGRLSPFAKPMKSVLLEFPGIIPATFLPVLKNLQVLSVRGTLPLSQWIAPSPEGILPGSVTNSTDNLPPAYSRSAEFSWDLTPILKRQSEPLRLSSTTLPDNDKILDSMEKLTTLDRGQCRALITGLTKEMSLIQGPPGTGKSYVGVQLVRVLLHNKKATNIGPIVCVCYTNHALDQFLEELLKKGIGKIVRVGGQSKSEEMEGKNLQTVARATPKTRIERNKMTTQHQSLGEIHDKAIKLCKDIAMPPDSWDAISSIFERTFPDLYSQLSNNSHDKPKEKQKRWEEEEEDDDDEEDDDEEEDGNPKYRDDWDGWKEEEEEEGEDSDGGEWQQVSTPQEIWDGWRGVWKSQAWNNRNANAKDDPHPARTLEEISACEDIWSMAWAERAKLVAYLSERAAASPIARLATLAQGQAMEISELDSQSQEIHRRCLDQADVIGITTTGLAKQVELLSRVNSKVVICEEAGEVLEAHLINAILPTCEHLIQIGDHQQLRPQINTFDLSLESRGGKVYSLDESMFERLVKENVALAPAQLNIQRRMRPGISSLIRNTLYPNLEDHPTVSEYPDVVGMRKNIFWLDHSYPEAGDDDSGQIKSHSNDWEVRMTHGLVRHLIRQSHYDSKDIAVLTPYTGQLQKLRLELRSSFEVLLSERDEEALARDGFVAGEEELEKERDPGKVGVTKANLLEFLRVATVDNFQGEEAKIVVISLVRSNEARKVGFLRTTNRVNVLLSRAKHGMYLIGNAETARSTPMWRDVCQMLRDADAIGTQLSLVCPRHRDTPIDVEEPEDFLRLSPEGGCDLPCDKRLDRCGHRCFSKCHSDGMHKAVACGQPCNRLHPACQHPCQKLCSTECGKCMMMVHNFLLSCGHVEAKVACWRTLPGEVIICRKSMMKTVPGCRHTVKEACCVDVRAPDYKCKKTCDKILPCGHPCTGTCGTCNTVVEGQKRTNHGICTRPCGRGFTTCNHTCKKPCHDGTPCGLCTTRCDVKCEHSRCTMSCQESCAPCAEPCAWVCRHKGRCLMPCAAPCERFPCDERCDRALACGHRCPLVCGEICPGVEFCQICCSKERKADLGVDMIEFLPYSSINLDENPILVLSCGHFFTRETLDGYLELYSAYSMDNQGNYAGYIDPEGILDEQTPKCPTCRQPLLQFSVRRYGRVINRAAIMEMTRRFLAITSSKYKELSNTLSGIERNLIESRDAFFITISAPGIRNTQVQKDLQLDTRLEGIKEFFGCLTRFVVEAEDLRQPATKLYENTITRKAFLNLPETQIGATLYFRPDTRLVLLAKILQIRSALMDVTERTLLVNHLTSAGRSSDSDNISVFRDKVSQAALATITGAFGPCRKLIDSARAQNLPKPEVEAISLLAKLVALWRQLPQDPAKPNSGLGHAIEEVTMRLDRADELCEGEFSGVDDMKEMLVAVRRQLNGGTFYQDVSEQEMASVVRAMRAELSVSYAPTGHWYYCQNGHPFTIGECGQAMQEMKCPECNAPVGGRNHTAASGVQSATDLEAIANSR